MGPVIIFLNKWKVSFINDTLNCSKSDIENIYNIVKIFISNKCCPFELSTDQKKNMEKEV